MKGVHFLFWIYLIFNVVMLVWLIGGRNKPRKMVWGGWGISVVFLLVHGMIEGLRWPMIPAYLLTLVPLIVLIAKAGVSKSTGQALLYNLQSLEIQSRKVCHGNVPIQFKFHPSRLQRKECNFYENNLQNKINPRRN